MSTTFLLLALSKILKKEVAPNSQETKNWSALGIGGVQNFWWEKFRGTCSAILRCFNQWLE